MVLLNVREIRKEIEYLGNDVVVRLVTDDSYTDHGDPIEELGSTKVSYTSGDDNITQNYGVNWLAQTFTTTADTTPPISDGGDDFNLTNLKLKLYRVGDPGTITVSVRATSSGVPTGTDLSTGNLDGDQLTTDTDGEWKTIDMSSYTLSGGVSGTQYSIIIRSTTGDSNNYVAVLGDHTSASYTGGQRLTSADSGVNWSAQASTDIMFNVYGDAAAVKAFAQILTQEDELVSEGVFQSGDILFWFKSDASNISRGNRVKWNSQWYEINEVVPHYAADTIYALEARTQKI